MQTYWIETNKIYKGTISANASRFRSLGQHTKTQLLKAKNATFPSTFQTLSNRESVSILSVKKSSVNYKLLYKN